jgi:hypothetical protein
MHNKTIELTDDLKDALFDVYEDLVNLPDDEFKHKLKTARLIAKIIDIDPDDFYIESGGYMLNGETNTRHMCENNFLEDAIAYDVKL